jgi:tyrosyl-tRNA synthetase
MADTTATLENQVEQMTVSAPPEAEKPHPSGLTLEERFMLCRSVAEECVSEDELRRLLNKPVPVAYDGFEPSGAQADLRSLCTWICHW